MDQDTVDSAINCSLKNNKKVPSIEALNSEMPCKENGKDKGKRMLRIFLNRLRLKKCASATISRPDPVYKVAYLGNVVTGWAKGAGCVEKPLATLWRNYTHSSRPDVKMTLAVTNGGLRATTKDHGLTEYWAHRLTTCAAPPEFPRIFCWVYRHEGRRLRHELRCHAVLCATTQIAKQIEAQLKYALQMALAEFKRDKISKQNARLSLVNSVYDNPTLPRRKILLSTGSHNYRPPLERSKSAPKLTSIEESSLEEEELKHTNIYKRILRHYDSSTALLDKRKSYQYKPSKNRAITPSRLLEVTSEEYLDEQVKHSPRINKVTFKEPELLDERGDVLLDELMSSSLSNDLLETCERAWLTALTEGEGDILQLDSDEGSLSSGCDSASTVTSDTDAPIFPNELDLLKTDLTSFKTLSQCREPSDSMLKYRGLNNNVYSPLPGGEEVSLVPVGETPHDFSSLKIFKRRHFDDSTLCDQPEVKKDMEEDTGSACSDESGYEEEDIASSVANIILV